MTAAPTATATMTQAPTPWTQSNANPSIAYDLFPTEVRTPTQFFSKARIILTLGTPNEPPKLLVFLDGPQGPGLVLEAIYDPSHIYGDSGKGLDVYAALDPANPRVASVVELRPMTGCGCGSQLKKLVPFSTMRHTRPPQSAGPLPAPPVLAAPAAPTP